jgi:hypothetical protein
MVNYYTIIINFIWISMNQALLIARNLNLLLNAIKVQ